MKVYIVTAGEYSDYHIEAVFDSKEKAEDFLLKNHCNHIEEFDLNPETSGERPEYTNFQITMDKDGNTTWITYNTTDHFKTDGSEDFTTKNELCCYVKAKDEKHAVKIANERRVQRKSNNEFE